MSSFIIKYSIFYRLREKNIELKEKGIRVTSIMPGATWSNSWAGIDLPRERLMEAKDIASDLGETEIVKKAASISENVGDKVLDAGESFMEKAKNVSFLYCLA